MYDFIILNCILIDFVHSFSKDGFRLLRDLADEIVRRDLDPNDEEKADLPMAADTFIFHTR